MERGRVVTFGEAMLRLSSTFGQRLEGAAALTVHVAGAEANVAVALARLGVPTSWVTALPDSPLGRTAASAVGAAGVDLRHVRWCADARMGLFFVDTGVGARPSTVWYDRTGSAFARYARWPDGALDGASYAVLSGITLGISKASRTAASRLLDEAERLGVPVCLDVNYRSRLWSAEQARTALVPVLRRADVVVCAESDMWLLFGVSHDPEDSDGSDSPDVPTGQDGPAWLRERYAPRARVCVVTRGSCGADGWIDCTPVHEPAVTTTIVDRFGMGDAFTAGLLSGLLDGCAPDVTLRRATAAAALKATTAGDHACFDLAELGQVAPGATRPRPGSVVR